MNSGLAIRGYACRFDRVFYPEGPHAMVVRPGGFEVAAAVPVIFDHDWQQPIELEPGALSSWQDIAGLAFELEVSGEVGHKAISEVASGRRACVSVCFAPDRDSEFGIFDGARAEIVTRTPIEEISLLAYGACPGAVAWVVVNGEDRVSAWHHEDWQLWRAGYQARLIGNHRGARVSPTVGIHAKAARGAMRRQPARRSVVPPSVIRLLDLAPQRPVVPASVSEVLRLVGAKDLRRAGRREAAAAQPMKPAARCQASACAPSQGQGIAAPPAPRRHHSAGGDFRNS